MIDAMSDPVLEMLTLTTVAIALLAGSYLVLNRTIYLDLGLFQLQLAAQPMAIAGPADALRHAGRRLRPDPQAGQRPLARSSAPRPRPTGSAP